MKVKGINKYYSAEIEREDDTVFITLYCVTGRRMCVGINNENWEKIKSEI